MLPESFTCVHTIENWEISLWQTALHMRSFVLSSHHQHCLAQRPFLCSRFAVIESSHLIIINPKKPVEQATTVQAKIIYNEDTLKMISWEENKPERFQLMAMV